MKASFRRAMDASQSQGWEALANARRLSDRMLDVVQFRYDTFPKDTMYQPLPWLGLNSSRRTEGSEQRWAAIEAALDDRPIRSAMDIGSANGYFTFSLAAREIPVLAVDIDPRSLRIARYARNKMGMSRVGLCDLTVEPSTVPLLPSVDLVLLLAVWHHWVRLRGLAEATDLLAGVWSKCEQVMFFETGESEMPAEFGLPDMGPTDEDRRQWLENYLTTTCVRSQIRHLGRYKAFAPAGNEHRRVAYRNLFVIFH